MKQPYRASYIFTATRNDGQPVQGRIIQRTGLNLYTFIREFGAEAGLGRYQILDIDPESPTVGHHLFQYGRVKLQVKVFRFTIQGKGKS